MLTVIQLIEGAFGAAAEQQLKPTADVHDGHKPRTLVENGKMHFKVGKRHEDTGKGVTDTTAPLLLLKSDSVAAAMASDDET